MKKLLTFISVIGLLLITSCNYNMVDLTYNYDYAYIKLSNGDVIEGRVDAWRDYEDGDQLQVTVNGVTYLVHSSNCTLIYRGEQI